jgi:hypothetical protein
MNFLFIALTHLVKIVTVDVHTIRYATWTMVTIGSQQKLGDRWITNPVWCIQKLIKRMSLSFHQL